MANNLFGCFTHEAQSHLIQTDPPATQTITGSLNVTGTVTAGSVIDGGTYTGNLEIDGDLAVTGSAEVTGDLAVTGESSVDALVVGGAATFEAAIGLAAAGFTMAAIARTATDTGATTGTIASGPALQAVTVTSDNADKIIILPAPTPGVTLIISVAATGYELRSSDPTTVAINGGTGADAESAIPANSTLVIHCATATAWRGLQIESDGTVAAIQPAA